MSSERYKPAPETDPHKEDVEAFEPESYEAAVHRILRDSKDAGLDRMDIERAFGLKYFGRVGYKAAEVWTPERVEKLESALEKVGLVDAGGLWHPRNGTFEGVAEKADTKDVLEETTREN